MQEAGKRGCVMRDEIESAEFKNDDRFRVAL